MPEELTYANLGIDKNVYNQFREICDKKGLKYGKQVEIMMNNFNLENTI